MDSSDRLLFEDWGGEDFEVRRLKLQRSLIMCLDRCMNSKDFELNPRDSKKKRFNF